MEKPRSLEALYEAFETYRQQHSFAAHPVNLYAPMQYIMDLGGKRARPLLCLSSCIAAGGSIEKTLPVSLAMEQFHNFTLIHDDIMDNSSLRRGKPTVHEKWNLPVAILSGDNLLVATYTLLHSLDLRKKQDVIALFNQTAREVCEGQQMDMDFANEPNVSVPQYLEMIRLKTAVLLGCSAASGALVANADAERVKLYYDFAIALGMAFQLKDDYLDTFGNPEKTGKKAGGDIVEGKKTWLYLSAQEAGVDMPGIAKLTSPGDKVMAAKAAFEELQLHTKLLELAGSFEQHSRDCLERLGTLGEDISLLKALCAMLAERES
jgi:geranylgeranyl diphosphate synthase type II